MTLALIALASLGLTGLAATETYRLTPDSSPEIRFTVDAPLDSIVGLGHGMAGQVDFDPQSGSGNGEISVDLSGFRTGISLRDEDLRERFFEVERYPRAVLKIQKLVGDIHTPTGIGTLSMHGIEHPVKVPLRIASGPRNGRAAIEVQGSLQIDFKDYNIQRPKVLFLKLGDRARVDVQVTLYAPENEPVLANTTHSAQPLFSPGEFLPVAHVTAKPLPPRFRFSANTPQGRGERLLGDAHLGSLGNALTCLSCHSSADERFGLIKDGQILPSHTLWNSASRPSLWQGLASNPGKAAGLCVRLFMLNRNGLKPEQENDFAAYLVAISPDRAVPSIDYQVMALTRSSGLANPTGGDRRLGVVLERRFCGGCHSVGKMRPPLTAGLYEADYLVRRVRWLDGHDARQMPPIYVDRLTDTDLRHIVTFLTGDPAQRVFDRRRTAVSQTGVP